MRVERAATFSASGFKQFDADGKPWGEAPRLSRGVMVDLSEQRVIVPPPELVQDTIPAQGIGFLAGQSGALKTFCAIRLLGSIATGEPFAGRKVMRRGGGLYVAFEGAGTIPTRIAALRTQLPDPSALLPIRMIERWGPVSTEDDFIAFMADVELAAKEMREAFRLPVRVVVVDTVSAAGMIAEDAENDPAAWQRIFDRLTLLSRDLEAVVILVHHYGKSASAGLRGSSNARAGADFVLAMTCDRDEITGDATGHRLALTKSREGAEGTLALVQPITVTVGEREDGSPLTSLILEFDADTKLHTLFPEKTKRKPPASVVAFAAAFDAALAEHGEYVHPQGDHEKPAVQAVRVTLAREAFDRLYVTATDDPVKRAETLRKQFKTGLDKREESGVAAGTWDDTEWLWRCE